MTDDGEQIQVRAIVCIAVIRRVGGQACVLIQRRSKRNAGRFRMYWELPQGHMDLNEGVLACAARELREETGLDDFRVHNPVGAATIDSEKLSWLRTLAVVEDGDNHFLGVCVVGSARGDPVRTDEAAAHRWIPLADIPSLLATENVFPLNIPMLRELVATNYS